MEDHSIKDPRLAIQIEPTDFSVAPGSSVGATVFLHNQSPADGHYELTVAGIPGYWVSVPSPVVRLAAGEQREVLVSIQPPASPQGQAGRHQVVIRVASQETPQQAVEATCTLTVAELEVAGRIGILLPATEFQVAQGESVAVPLVLLNQGLERDIVSLSVEGIPSDWVMASSASTPLSPGQQQEVTLTIQPAPSEESGAGRHPFRIQAASQATPDQVTVAECVLSIASSSQFGLELHPQQIEAGEPARVTVENQGNAPQQFDLTLQSPDDGLDFQPNATQILHIPPGEVEMAEFTAKLHSRSLFGKDRVLPFTARVQAAEGETQNLTGEVVGKPWIPTWLALAGLVALLVCACLSVLAAIYVGSREEATPTPIAAVATQVPTVEMTATTTPVSGDLWQQIQATGRIVVGTSADYPPFEFYASENQIDGFDIALMDEIGRRLGIQVEYRDYAFDGLAPAIRLGEIHVAVAAISRTPEREAELDFSNVYLVSGDAFLAREDADLSIGSIGDAARYRIGVQRNTVHQDWIQLVLIDAGKMSPDNLFVYEKAEHAIRDLREGRIDLVLLDVQPAKAFVDEGGLKIVAEGLNPQNYAIALPKGASTLKAQLDQTITVLYNDGTIGNLAQRYMGMQQVLPTPTPGPTSTAAPPPACDDGLLFVQDLTQEGDLGPGQAFTKGWQVQNTGTCTWNTSYRLVFADGYSMGGGSVAVTQDVAPGGTYDLQINLVAPVNPGDYQGFWQMVNGGGYAFGERLQVNIRVIAGPTLTPAPTQTPVAGIIFTVDRNAIQAGECVNFAWKVENVKEVYFYREGEPWQDHGVAGEGTRVECPPATTTYHLRVVLLDGSVEVREIPIYVEAVADAPQITLFTIDPSGQITLGQCVTVRWQVEGKADRVFLTANDVVLWDGAPVSGNYQDCPTTTGSVTYGLEATGPGGTSRRQETITVVDTATAIPEATPEPEATVTPEATVAPENPLAGTQWTAIAYSDGSAVQTVLPGTSLTADFGADGTLSGSAGCNNYSASYLTDGNLLTIYPPQRQQAVCAEPEGIMEQEQDFLAALVSASAFSMEGGQLFVKDASGLMVVQLIGN
jgi:polar amino acid transport system substrate-binding protein